MIGRTPKNNRTYSQGVQPSCYASRVIDSFPIEVSIRDSEHVRITTSDAERFDEAFRELLPRETAAAAFDLKPYLFLVSNPSSRTVVAYCIRFVFSNVNGSVHKEFDHCKNPTAVLTDGSVRSHHNEPLKPGDRRVISAGAVFPLNPAHSNPSWIPDYRDYLQQMHPPGSVKRLSIEVDAVILDDGTLTGANESNFGIAFSTFVSTEREVFRSIVESVDTGKSLDEVFATLTAESQQLATDPDRAFEPLRFEIVQSRGEAYGIWRRSGDGEFLRIARAIVLNEPFVVRRKD